MTDAQLIVQKLWNYCNVLRDDGLSYGDYVEQLTFLLFLKMADERMRPPYNEKRIIPENYDWQSLSKLDGPDLDAHYRRVLEELGRQGGLLGVIFSKAQNRIQDPAKLRRLIVDLIGREDWTALDADVKGDAYEGLLQKNAEDTKGGAGQYFTPRPLIQALVEVTQPTPGMTICDPACGTGGFLLAAHKYISEKYRGQLDVEEKEHLDNHALRGFELVDSVARLCLMNMALHGIGGKSIPVKRKDSLERPPDEHFAMVLTNPPFGKKSSVTIVNEKGEQSKESLIIERPDFWATTSNKQLNFLQHVYTLLDINGKAAIVVPDNVLFEGGAGKTIRENLLRTCDVHTLLRLPTGIFYAQGVKANVLFFDRKPANESAWTKEVWIYDFRTNQNFTLKERPLQRSDLDDFVGCFNPENRHDRKETPRFKAYSYEELIKRDKANLDIFWLRDDSLSDNLDEPDIISGRILEDLQIAVDRFSLIVEDMKR